MIWKFTSIGLVTSFLLYLAFPFIYPKQYAITDDEIALIKGYIDQKNDRTKAVLDSLQDERNMRIEPVKETESATSDAVTKPTKPTPSDPNNNGNQKTEYEHKENPSSTQKNNN